MINRKNFSDFTKLPENGNLRVLFFQANHAASGYYRIGFIAEELATLHDVEVDLVDSGNYKDILFRIGYADVVVFQLQTDKLILEVIKVCKKMGIKTVMDMDDDLLNVPEHNPASFTLGRHLSSLWDEPKKNKFMNVEENRERLKNLEEMLKTVDLITVTGVGLRNRYSKLNKIKILPNSVDHRRITVSKRSGGFLDKNIRIFWQGSSTHAKDLELIRDAVREISEKYKHVKWVIWGSGYESFAELCGISKNRVESIRTINMEKYYKRLSKIKMDIGICPLVVDDYNKCKSNVKWLEYSYCGIPSVVSGGTVYTEIHDGLTGLVANDTEGWVKHLSRLIEQSFAREVLANAAKAQVLQSFNIHTNIDMWKQTFKRLKYKNA